MNKKNKRNKIILFGIVGIIIIVTIVITTLIIINRPGEVLTSLEWQNNGEENSDSKEEWLKIAVDDTSYKGYILKAGTYSVTQTDGKYSGTAQRIYNLYVTDLDTDNYKEVETNTYPTPIGGINDYQGEITISKGQYLYVKKSTGGQVGKLKLELK